MIEPTTGRPLAPSTRHQPASLLLLLCLALASAVVLLGVSTATSSTEPPSATGSSTYADLATANTQPAATALPTASPESAPLPKSDSRPFAVYLQPDGIDPDAQLDIPAIERTLGDLTFISVTTVAELIATVDATQPFSIWFHHAALNDIPADWINAYRKNSTVIVGIDMSTADFATLVSSASDRADWNPPGVVTYVIYSERVSGYQDAGLETPVAIGGSSMMNHYIRDVHDPYLFLHNVVDSITLSLQRVLAMTDADLGDIPPILAPAPDQTSPTQPGPALTPQFEEQATDIALADPRIVAALDGHPHHVSSIGFWMGDHNTPLGAGVTITIDDSPADITADWAVQSPQSCVLTDQRDQVAVTYRVTYANVWAIIAFVDVDAGQVASVYPGLSAGEASSRLDAIEYSSEHELLECTIP